MWYDQHFVFIDTLTFFLKISGLYMYNEPAH